MKVDLYKGDCLEQHKHIKDGSVDLILTDLPYGTTACAWDEIIPFEKIWEVCYRILRPNGFIVMTASQPFTTKLINSNIENFSHQWIWEKEQGSNPLLANKMPMKNFEDVIVFSKNSYDTQNNNPLREYFKSIMHFIKLNLKQINNKLGHRRAEHTFYVESTQFGLCTEKTYNELIKVFKIDTMDNFKEYLELKNIDLEFMNRFPRTYNPQMEDGSEYTSGGGYIKHLDNNVSGGNKSNKRFPKSIIKFNTNKNKSQHPTSKPIPLLEYLIITYTNENDLVVDLTMGSGSCGVAAKNTNRNFIGIEMDDGYFDIAKKRIEDKG
jgi:site-specific DNA-methyltransferase (adenine-specific)